MKKETDVKGFRWKSRLHILYDGNDIDLFVDDGGVYLSIADQDDSIACVELTSAAADALAQALIGLCSERAFKDQ